MRVDLLAVVFGVAIIAVLGTATYMLGVEPRQPDYECDQRGPICAYKVVKREPQTGVAEYVELARRNASGVVVPHSGGLLFQTFEPGRTLENDNLAVDKTSKLREFVGERIPPAGNGRIVTVLGHSDFVRVKAKIEGSEVCSSASPLNSAYRKILRPRPENLGGCLGFMRAIAGWNVVAETGAVLPDDTVRIAFDDDPLMEESNAQLEGLLYAVLQINPKTLFQKYEVPEGWRHSTAADYPEFQVRLEAEREEFNEAFKQLRNVVVYLDECRGSDCGR